jgi:hypothetical protein
MPGCIEAAVNIIDLQVKLTDLESFDNEDVVMLAAGYLRLREAAKALIDALPKCVKCGKSATRTYCPYEYCDDCCSAVSGEFPHAAPLRALIALLKLEAR